MIRYLIDTNVVSEMRKPKPHGGALAWLQSLQVEQVFFSAVTFGEIQSGVEIARRENPVKANEIEAWATKLERASQVLPMDSACFREYARLMYGRSDMLAEDAMIAATARVHVLTVATRNERDFSHFGLSVVNPFKVKAKP
ncbi:MAG TPA: type II toxin-antitoxin system VapC family toxin [Candidatus Cybelea sp.]|nr:type II toxin-antitoxin system VapC family toxin [Candidatus Cybelea sp.]